MLLVCWQGGAFADERAQLYKIEQYMAALQTVDVDPVCLERLVRTGGLALLVTLCDLFARSWIERRARLDTAISQADWHVFELTAHSLGSSAGNLGLRAVEQLARGIENSATAHNGAELAALGLELESAWQRAEPQLRLAISRCQTE